MTSVLDRLSIKTKVLYAIAILHLLLLLAYISITDEKTKVALWQRLVPAPDAIPPNISGPLPASQAPPSDDWPMSECGYLIRKPADGRLGSHMFAYASFYGMAKKQAPYANKTAIIRVWSQPPYLAPIFEHLSLRQRVMPDRWFVKNEPIGKDEPGCCRYGSGFVNDLACDGRHIHVLGFGCSFQYFVEYFEDIKKEFTFKESIRKSAYQLLADSLSAHGLSQTNCTIIGVHLRRGDFLDQEIYNYGHFPATQEYLQRAVNFFETKLFNKTIFQKSKCLAFVLFGNEYDWNLNASQQTKLLHPKDAHFVLIDPKTSKPEIDMVALSMCDHMAVSTGTFGWWAAFFNRGLITYQKEYARLNSRHFAEYEPKDYFLPHWIPL